MVRSVTDYGCELPAGSRDRQAAGFPVLAGDVRCRGERPPTRGAPKDRGTAIMKLTTTTQVSVDGVTQGNGGRHPLLDPGFERGGWARPLFDSEATRSPSLATPTGRTSPPCTTSSSTSTPRRSSPSTGPSRWPSLTARRWHWRPSTVLSTSWPTITSTIRPVPTCCAGWATVSSHARPTTKPSGWRATPPKPPYLTRRRDQLG